MNEPSNKSESLYVRVTPAVKRRLVERASQLKMHHTDVVRELVVGFIEGRVTVSPPQNVKEFYSES